MANKRHLNLGKESLLTDVQQTQLWQVLSEKAPDGGLWNGRKVADWLSQLLGEKIDRRRGWEYLKQMTFRLRVHDLNIEKLTQLNKKAGKKLNLKLQFLQAKYPNAQIEVWSMDEHRLGLHPILRRVWISATVSGNFDTFPSIVTFTQDGNYFATGSNQSGVASVPSYGNIQGRWKCTSSTEITTTAFNFNYPTATLPGTIGRTDLHATFDPKNGVVQATATLKSFALNANLLNDDAPVARTFTFTGQRVKP